MKKFFKETKNPSMDELVQWFYYNYPDLARDMSNTSHAAYPDRPNPFHLEGDVLTHTMMVCQNAKNLKKTNKIAALLHDIGKPLCKEVIDVIEGVKPENYYSKFPKLYNEYKEKHPLNEITFMEYLDLNRKRFKTRFIGHEGVSVYLSIDILKNLQKIGIITNEEIKEIITIIGLHGELFNYIKDSKEYNSKKLIQKWKGIPDIFRDYIEQVKCDSKGRFSINTDQRTNSGDLIGSELFGNKFFNALKDEHQKFMENKNENLPTLTLMVGIPNSGKSTLVKEMKSKYIISRDSILVEYGKEKYNLDDYNEIWKTLSPKDQQEIDRILQKQFMKAYKEKVNIVIDMTNTSKKSRKKWVNAANGYYKKAIVCLTDYQEILHRNTNRENKIIPRSVIERMMKSFTIPLYDEIHELEFIFQ